ncbi:MAG: preprotein translocase subunit SecE [Deltaproteobacteria bacterium]|jgi:preprotein translocase subunit SecE|nr:preprotein translocase subunit SecE [Deltaproteobacteria bacterium]
MTKHRKNKPSSDQVGGALAKKPAVPAPKPKPKRESQEIKPPTGIKRLIAFLKDARRELTRVTWPTRKETIHSTGVLLALVAIAALYLFIVDNIINLAVVDGLRELLLKIVVKLKL